MYYHNDDLLNIGDKCFYACKRKQGTATSQWLSLSILVKESTRFLSKFLKSFLQIQNVIHIDFTQNKSFFIIYELYIRRVYQEKDGNKSTNSLLHVKKIQSSPQAPDLFKRK